MIPYSSDARHEGEDHEQRMGAERLAHHTRDDDVALELVDAEIEEPYPEGRRRRVDRRQDDRRQRSEDRADVRDDLRRSRPEAEDQGVLIAIGPDAGQRERVDAEPRARADQERDGDLASHIADQAFLDLRTEPDAVGPWWKHAVDAA